MRLPPDIQFHEDIRLLVYRPRGLLNEATVNKIINIGSWLAEVNDDTGPTADRFHGFRGRAFGVGPIVTYTTKIGKSLLDLNARFIPEFGNENRVQGNLFQFAAT